MSEIEKSIEYIKKELQNKKIKSDVIAKTLLLAEEVIRTTIENSKSEDDVLSVKVIKYITGTEVRISAKGEAFEPGDIREGMGFSDDAESDAVIRKLIGRVMGDNLTVRNQKGINVSVVKVAQSKYKQLIITLLALFLGMGAGFLMKGLLTDSVNDTLTKNIFTPITTMFLNALKMVVAPLVLFSIASSIAEFGDMKALGRIAGKVIGSYFITSFIAIMVGLGIYFLIPIGNPELQSAVTDAAASTVAKGAGVSASVIDTIVGVIPSDVINPFLKADMLQIIFIAAMIGIAAGALSNKLKIFRDFLNDGYAVFSKITAMIIKVMPLAIFCSMAKMILSMKLSSLVAVFSWIPTVYLADIMMLGVYALIVLLIGKLNPLKFFKKFYPAMITAFTFAASNPSLPTSMSICDKELGISKKIYSFSLPLGATINMDGGCITQIISALFMAKIFDIPITGSVIFSLVLAIFVLSVGAPGVPGGTLVCISILLPQIGIPAEAISIIMGLYSIAGMMLTCVNVTGDAVVTLVVGKSEKLVDLKTYNS